MKAGETFEMAIWLDGGETPAMIEHYQRDMIPGVLKDSAKKAGVLIAPAAFEVKRPGEERVPPVPKWLEDRVAEHGRLAVTIPGVLASDPPVEAPVLLVAEARVLGPVPDFSARSFLADLSPLDLKKLRAITKRSWLESNPEAGPLTDSEADAIIERHGPDAAYEVTIEGTRH